MNNLLRLIGRRLVALPIMVVGVSFLVFSIMWLSPVDPAYSALGESATPQALEAYRAQHGLNDPFFIQYGRYLWNMIHGDLGTYGAGSSSVSDLVSKALPLTLQLTFLGLFIAVLISFPLGVLAALYRDRWPDQVIRVFSVIGIGTPSFWLAALLVLAFLHSPLKVSGEVPADRQPDRLVPAHASARHRPGGPGHRSDDPRRAHLDGRGAGPRLRPHRRRCGHPQEHRRGPQRPA